MAASEQELFKGFSCPTDVFHDSFLHEIATQYARAILEVFLGCFGTDLKRCAGVTERLEEVCTSDLEFNALWSPALTMCFRATSLQNSPLAHRAAAEMLLQVTARGIQGDWEIELKKPSFFLWDSWLLPKSDYLSVSNSGETASITTRGQGNESRILFRRTAHGLVRWSRDEGVPLPTLKTEHDRVVVLPKGIINPTDLDGFRDHIQDTPTGSPEASQTLESALDLLKAASPAYSKWVYRVIQTAAEADLAEMDNLKGAISPGACAVVFIYDRQDVLSQAEALVHAAAHNYFYLLTALDAPVEPATNELYYSPFIGMMRTFDRLLASYHASANGYLFYRACRNTLPEFRELCAERMKHRLVDLRRAEKMIKENKGLTPIGSALIDPLIEELREEY